MTERAEKLRLAALLVEKLGPGRTAQLQAPSEKDLRATSVPAMPLDEVLAKVRVGPPVEEPEDLGIDVWAGVVRRSRCAPATRGPTWGAYARTRQRSRARSAGAPIRGG